MSEYKSVSAYDYWLAAPIVRKFEGLRLNAYKCPAGVWTIGYGHTANVKPNDKITQMEAEALLSRDLIHCQRELAQIVKVKVTEGQFIALMSWIFNLGNTKEVRSSKLLKELNAGRYEEAGNQLPRWNKSGGKVISGLVARRAEEQSYFFSDS